LLFFAVLASLLATPTPTTIRVTARVLDVAGKPVVAARVHVWDSTFALDGVAYEADGTTELWNPTTGITGADGGASFTMKRQNAPPSSAPRFAVVVTAPDFAPAFRVVEATGADLAVGDVTLPRGAHVAVRVTCDARPCSSRESVQLSITTPGAQADVRNSALDDHGVALFSALPAGKARVSLHWGLGVPGERLGDGNFDVVTEVPIEVDLVAARTGAGYKLAGKVVDPSCSRRGVACWLPRYAAARAVQRSSARTAPSASKTCPPVNASSPQRRIFRSCVPSTSAGLRNARMPAPPT
jgi:hypothetical protein